MPKLRIADLLARAPVDPEAHLDHERVRRYANDVAGLPPVVVFDTPEGLLLADGYHRVAVARRAGAGVIEAHVCRGTPSLPQPQARATFRAVGAANVTLCS
jgi:hypothetical protein